MYQNYPLALMCFVKSKTYNLWWVSLGNTDLEFNADPHILGLGIRCFAMGKRTWLWVKCDGSNFQTVCLLIKPTLSAFYETAYIQRGSRMNNKPLFFFYSPLQKLQEQHQPPGWPLAPGWKKQNLKQNVKQIQNNHLNW